MSVRRGPATPVPVGRPVGRPVGQPDRLAQVLWAGVNVGAKPFKGTTNGGSFAPTGYIPVLRAVDSKSKSNSESNSLLERSRMQVQELKLKIAELKRLNAEFQAKHEVKKLLDSATEPIEDELEDVLEQKDKASEDGPLPEWLMEAEETLREDLARLEGQVSIARTELDGLLESQNRVIFELLEMQADLQVALATLRASDDGTLQIDNQAQKLQKDLKRCLSDKNNLESELAVLKAQRVYEEGTIPDWLLEAEERLAYDMAQL